MLSSDTPTAARANMLMACAIALGFLALYLSSLGSVPFHPDESTQIYMSRDFDVAVLERNPAALAWTAGQPLTPEMRLRLLDAPMTKYLIGIGRWLRGFTPADSNVDWVWGATWDENRAAIPANSLLLAARLPTAVLGALVAVLAFGIGAQLGGAWLGVLAALLVGLDPLLLLHSRRAMAESALTFFSALAALGTLALVVHGDSLKRLSVRTLALGALAGVLAGLAMDSKQTELVMLPVALGASALSMLQRPWTRSRRLASLCAVWLAIGLGWALGVWLLNPVLYREPVGAVQAMLALRANLAREQIAVNGASDAQMVLKSVPSRLGAAVSQLYFQPAAAWDVPVYLEQLRPPADAYFANPINSLLRIPPLNLALAALSVVGIAGSGLRLFRCRLDPSTRAEQVLWLWSLLTLVLLALTIPLNWQRYFMPLLAPSRLFASLGLLTLARLATRSTHILPSLRTRYQRVP